MLSKKRQILIAFIGLIAGGLIYYVWAVILPALPYSESYLASFEYRWQRAIVLYLGLIGQYSLATVIVLPFYGISFAPKDSKNVLTVSRLLTIGALISITIGELKLLGGRNQDMFYALYIGQIFTIFIFSFLFVKIGNILKLRISKSKSIND